MSMLSHDTDRRVEKAQKAPSGVLDPILTLQVGSRGDGPLALGSGSNLGSISSLCFVSSTNGVKDDNEHEDSESSDSGGDDDMLLPLRTRMLVQHDEARTSRGTQNATSSATGEKAASMTLAGRYLANCQINGDCSLWDLGRRARVQAFAQNRGPGLLLRRTDERDANSRILYQTRNDEGTVSLHDMNVVEENSVKAVATLETNLRTFCAASPCRNNPDLVALPSEALYLAMIHDWRTSKDDIMIHAAGMPPTEDVSELFKHGVLTSLALSQDDAGGGVLACGMETGSLFFHDLRMTREPCFSIESVNGPPCSIKLSNDPILSLDMVGSQSNKSTSHAGVVAIAGMAGDFAELSDLAPQDRGTIAVLKSSCDGDNRRNVRLRSRLETCDLKARLTSGKPGVSICRFRPDERIFAVGGWDYRLRVFDRAAGTAPLAVLKGHTASVNAFDWSSDAELSGLLATGGADGQLNVWRLFSR